MSFRLPLASAGEPKIAIKRGQSQARLGYAEREQLMQKQAQRAV